MWPSWPVAWTRCWASSPSPRSLWLRCGQPFATPVGRRSSWGVAVPLTLSPPPVPTPPEAGCASGVGPLSPCPLLSCTQVCPLGWGASGAPSPSPASNPSPPKHGGKRPWLIKTETGGKGLLLHLATGLGPSRVHLGVHVGTESCTSCVLLGGCHSDGDGAGERPCVPTTALGTGMGLGWGEAHGW